MPGQASPPAACVTKLQLFRLRVYNAVIASLYKNQNPMPELFAFFARLDQLLTANQALWRLQPLQLPQIPWTDPSLLALLDGLSLDDCDLIDQSPQRQQQLFGAFWPELFALDIASPAMFQPQGLKPPFWLATDIGGRKWQQILLFAEATAQTSLPVLEWCAGKGHLGRVLAQQFQLEVCSVEWQQPLCEQGAAVAQKLDLKQRFVCRDVLQHPVGDLFAQQQQVVALHACGDLHRSLLVQAVAAQSQQVDIVPCCYHLQQTADYQPMSKTAQQSALRLSKTELKLAVQGQVTGGERVRRLRQTEMWWRRAYQLWRAELTGDSRYQPLASVPKHWFSGEFRPFAEWAAAQHQLVLPPDDDGSRFLQQAEPLLLTQRRIELVQHLFRRPLELWLVLDRALYLAEQGYQVQLQQLCEMALTPRNLLISARKTS